MANADFRRNETGNSPFSVTGQTPAAAERVSGRTARRQTPELTPLQKKLQQIEAKLPGGASARVIAAAMALVAVLGLGGVKLRSYHDTTAASFTVGSTAADDQGDSMMDELNIIVNEAATVLRDAARYDDDGVQFQLAAAQNASDTLMDAMKRGDIKAMYAANRELYSAVDGLRGAVRKVDSKANLNGSTAFFSHQTILGHLKYNEEAQEYNRLAGRFPAGLIGALWNCGEVELFA